MSFTSTSQRSAILMTVAFAIAACTITVAQSTPGVSLKWKFEKGDSSKIEMVQEQAMSMEMLGQKNKTSTVTKSWMTWTTSGVDDSGVATVNTVIDRMTIDAKTPLGLSKVDTDVAANDPGQDATMGKLVRGLVGVPTNQQMLSTGKVLTVTIPDQMKKALGPGGGSMLEAITKNSSLEFPEKPLVIGDNWSNSSTSNSPAGKMNLKNSYVYKGVVNKAGKQLHHFTVAIEMDFPKADGAAVSIDVTAQDTHGNMYFDASRGRLDHSNVQQDVQMTIKAPGQEIKQVIESSTTVTFGDG